MANEDLRVRITAQIQGLDAVESLKNAVRQLQGTAAPAAADLQKLKNAAMQLGSASDRTENDLRRSINALKDVRSQLSLTDSEYRKLTRTINQYQAQLEKATGAQQRGGRALQFAQTAGAVAASGVFGGPEGLLGAGIGAMFGGPAGAMAGGAVGAQVGMMRQQVAGLADYAGELEKQRIALRNVSGSALEYQRALQATAEISARFNVPIGEATQGFTQLAASVVGAGGKIADAEIVYRNISAAIKASGGGTEQVQGAMTALSQIFSKGKVSAEELSGQLGERLPGAVTLFAKATGRSLPQLQKDLEQGVVGLGDVMKFVVSLGDRYSATADKIAKSDADAGARFQTSLANLRAAVGKELMPLGAELQNSIASFLVDATPALTALAQGFVAAARAIATATSAFMDFTAPVRDFFANGLLAYGRIFSAFWDSIGNDIDAFKKRFVGAVDGIGKLFGDLFNFLKNTGKAALQSVGIDTQWLAGVTRGIVQTLGDTWNALFNFVSKRWKQTVSNMVNYSTPLFAVLKLAGVADVGAAVTKGLEAGMASQPQTVNRDGKGDLQLPPAASLTQWQNPDGNGGKDKEAEKARKQAIKDQTELNRLLQEQLRLNFEAGNIGSSTLDKLAAEQELLKQITRLKIDEATLTSDNEKIRRQRIVNITTEYQKEKARIEEERKQALAQIQDLDKQAAALIGKFNQRSDKTESPLTRELQTVENAIRDAAKGADELLKKLNEIAGTRPEAGKLRAQIGNFKEAQLGMSPEERTRRATANLLNGDITGLQNDISNLQLFGQELSTLDRLKQKYLADWDRLDPVLRQQLETLAAQKDMLEQNAKIVESIVAPLQQGLTSVFDVLINGTQNWGNSLREIAATALRDIAKQLIRILVIEQAIQAVRGIFSKLLPAPAPAAAAPVYAANGYAFAQNGIQPFAMGGIVDRPTLFKFANGGALRTGVMGEAGPEAIIPLRRGRDGKLGVSGGGSNTSVVVNVDASGSQVQGNSGQGEQLGRAISQAVQAELLKQKRPGGLLAA